MSLQIGAPLLILAALLQASVLPTLRISGGQPDLVVIITLAWALLDDGVEAALWAVVGGLALDLFSGAPMGFSTLRAITMVCEVCCFWVMPSMPITWSMSTCWVRT